MINNLKPISLLFHTPGSAVEVTTPRFPSPVDLDLALYGSGVNLHIFCFGKLETQAIIHKLDLDDFEVMPSYCPPGMTMKFRFEDGPIAEICVKKRS